MEQSINKSLLPEFVKKPAALLWVMIIPQAILLLINLWSYWIISDEVTSENIHVAYSVLSAQIGMLLLAGAIWWLARTRKEAVALVWNAVFLVAHVGYLWYAGFHMWRVIPPAIEPWVLGQGTLMFYQFTFMMPGLFYAGLRLACFEVKLKGFSDVGLSVLLTVLGPAMYYVLFIGLSAFRYGAWMFPVYLTTLLFVVTTVLTYVGLTRLVVIGTNHIRSRDDITQIAYMLIFAVLLPIAGLLLNRVMPFPADFQTPWVYALAVVNGLIVMMPRVKKADGHGLMLFARSVTYPFTFYFFLVFLPFLPLSLPAVFAMGMGFLILVPTVLFLMHTKKLADDFKFCAQAYGRVLPVVLIVAGLAVMPAYFTVEALRDKMALKSALDYVYAPDQKNDVAFTGSVKAVKRTLVNLKKFKEGVQLPYLSGFYNRMVFEGMVLPDKKIDRLYALFTGGKIRGAMIPSMWGSDAGFFARGRRGGGSWSDDGILGVRPQAVDRNVALASFRVDPLDMDGITKSRLYLEMKNAGDSLNAEFVREIELPQSVLITDFALKVEDEMVPGRIFEKRAGMWVYHMIRDFTARDPGILTYQTPTRVRLNVYPFRIEQTRYAEIEFSFPTGTAPSIQFDGKTIPLEGESPIASPVVMQGIWKNRAVLIIPESRLGEFYAAPQKPYLHFILDFSTTKSARRAWQEGYARQIEDVIARYGQGAIRLGKITAANYDIADATASFIDLSDRAQVRKAVEGIALERRGSLDLGRVIAHHLVKGVEPIEINGRLAGPHPLFVVITDDASSVLEPQKMEFFQTLLPYEDGYLVSTAVGKVEEAPLWTAPPADTVDKYITVRVSDVVSCIPAQAGRPHVIPYHAGRNQPPALEVLDPDTGEYRTVPNVRELDPPSGYVDGLGLNLINIAALHDPAKFDAELGDIVKRSRELNVMAPSTSFIIVERSSQWKTLSAKERERLRASEGLEFEEDFDTPAPPAVLLLLLFFAYQKLRRRKVR